MDSPVRSVCRLWRAALCALALAFAPQWACASLFQGETLDSVAMGIAWFVIVVMPIAGIVIFWKLHVLPEKIAEQRHHPQKDAIHVLCLLSLVFGGLLWPIAWLWAYIRPTTPGMAFGAHKHEDYYHQMADKWRAGELGAEEVEDLRDELDAMAATTRLPRRLRALHAELTQAAAAAPTMPATPAHGAA